MMAYEIDVKKKAENLRKAVNDLRWEQELAERRKAEKNAEAIKHANKVQASHERGLSDERNARGEKDTKENLAIMGADKIIGQEATSYNIDAMSSNSACIHNIKLLVDVLNYWMRIPGDKKLPGLKAYFGDKSDQILHWISGTENHPVPTLHHLVKVENGRLQIDSLSADLKHKNLAIEDPYIKNRIDALEKEIDSNFKDLAKAWLQQQGVELKNEVDPIKDGNLLSTEDFNKLKNDPAKGFQRFLEVNAPRSSFKPIETETRSFRP